jgi:hypothetical protein
MLGFILEKRGDDNQAPEERTEKVVSARILRYISGHIHETSLF